MTTCPTCKGKKTQTIRAVEWSVGGKKKLPPVDINCMTCNGVGTVTPKIIAQLKAERAMWCRCSNSSESHYIPDMGGMKHHYVCNDCGKITQIG